MKDIEGRITFHDRNGTTIATVEFPDIDVRFYIAAAGPADLKRSIMDMVETNERVGRIFMETGCLDWEALGGKR